MLWMFVNIGNIVYDVVYVSLDFYRLWNVWVFSLEEFIY